MMLPRFKSLVVLTFIVLALYAVFWRDEPFSSQHAVDVLKGLGDFEVPWGNQDTPQEPIQETKVADASEDAPTDIEVKFSFTKTAHIAPTYFSVLPSEPESTKPAEWEHGVEDMKTGQGSTKTAAELLKPSSVAGTENNYSGISLQKQFDKEYDELALSDQAGAIYGNTLKALIDIGAHEGFAGAALKPLESWSEYSDTPPYTYNPYPDYNSKVWQDGNQGTYTACNGPNGPIADLLVYSGHPKAFSSPQMGSYIPLDIDSNLCFEREARLGPYGFTAEEAPSAKPQAADSEYVEERDASKLDWGKLQKACYKMNVNRYTQPHPQTERPMLADNPGNFTMPRSNRTSKVRPSTMARRLDTLMKKVLSIRQGVSEMIPNSLTGDGGVGAEPSRKKMPGFQPDTFVEAPPATDPKEDSPSGGKNDYSVGWEKFDNANSEDRVAEYSTLGGDVPMNDHDHGDSLSSGFEGSRPVKNLDPQIPEFSTLGGDAPMDEHDHGDSMSSGLEGSKPVEDLDPHRSSSSDKEADEFLKGPPTHDVAQWSKLGGQESSDEPEKGRPKFPGEPPITPALNEDEAKAKGLHGMPAKVEIKPAPRTAVIIRTYSHLNFTENDKQNIRAMVSELCLRSGGEYEIFLLVEWKDETLPIFSSKTLYEEAVEKSVPKEFAGMTVLWNDAKMRETYPLIPREVNNVHQSQWLSVQWFAQEHPHFDYYWNWEFDTRYTGHYYNLLEKLATFAKAQPRKGLWERNERYYIPSYHGRYSQFTRMVEKAVGADTVWGAPPVVNVTYIGSGPPVNDPKDDKFVWSVGEEADYITLSPIFNPVNTSWPGRNDVWGYDGPEKTPRRATIGTQSRCSKKLLDTMHAENKKGNHVSSEMTPQTVSLLHGLKAVYAPIPMFFDRPWGGESLQRFFNPGPKGQSGSIEESPYSWGREVRFQGSTWYYRATSPQRLYNNWLGWEDSGIGGAEWEKTHGRTCLPPLLLHPIKDVVQPAPGSSSKSELPY